MRGANRFEEDALKHGRDDLIFFILEENNCTRKESENEFEKKRERERERDTRRQRNALSKVPLADSAHKHHA